MHARSERLAAPAVGLHERSGGWCLRQRRATSVPASCCKSCDFPAMTSSTDFAALLCSRLCHDLLSPVSALGNGLELLATEEDEDMREHCFALVEQSARASAARLKFYRLAFGAAGSTGDEVATEEARSLIAGLAADDSKLTLEWAVEPVMLAKPAVKVLLNLAAIGLDALVRGGTLAVGAERFEGATEIALRASGPRIAFDAEIGRALAGEVADGEATARTAPALLVRRLAEERGGDVQHALASEALVIGAVLPDG